MKLLTTYCLLLITLMVFPLISKSQNPDIPIVPAPQVIEATGESFTIDKNIVIRITGIESAKNFTAAEEIQKTLSDFNKIAATVVFSDKIENKKGVKYIILEQIDSAKLTENKYPKFDRESYYLTIDNDKILIRASNPAGIFYGAISLIQLLEKAKNNTIPTVKIVDWSDLHMRGISDDISRGQVSNMDNFKKIIRNLSRYKMNTYMPYIEDMLQFDAYPSIGKGRGALSKDEVRELIAYAKKYFVEIIPVFQTLGHYENILSQDEFLKYAEFPGAASLNVSSDSTYMFLENMLKEVFELFPSEFINIGADESYDVGLGKSKTLVKKYDQQEKIKNKNNNKIKSKDNKDNKENDGIADVHAQHYRKVFDICKKYNKKVMMYSDIILKYPKLMELIPKDIIMVDWHYNPANDYNSTAKFRDAGFKYIVSPAVWNFYSAYPVNVLALPNIVQLTESGVQNGSIGMINSNWGDYGAETFKELNYFGYAWSAQCAWNYKASSISTFSRNYFYDFFGFDDARNTVICQTLSSPLNQVPWHELWRHPLLPFRDPPYWEGKRNIITKISWMDWTMPLAENFIDELQSEAVKNKDHYDLWRYIVRLDNYYKLKIQTQEMLMSKQNKEAVDDKLLMNMIDDNINSLAQLRDSFDKLWLAYYKKDNLNMIDDKFNRLILYFGDTKKSVINNNIQLPTIKSDWIYLKSGSKFADKADFKKDFILESKPDSAYLQLMGDTYAKLYINGKYVDQVYARSSLSLLVDYKRMKIIDINKYLKDSLNTIEVHCENYNENDKAGCNIYSEIYLKNKNKALLTDESWYGKAEGNDKWNKAVPQKYGKYVIAPDFKNKRTSWIER